MINIIKCDLWLFLFKCVFRWSENSVRFENLMGIRFLMGRILWDFISHCEVWHVLKTNLQLPKYPSIWNFYNVTPYSFNLYDSIDGFLKCVVLTFIILDTHIVITGCHHQPTRETPLKWCFTGVPMLARKGYWYGPPLPPKKYDD